MGGLRVRLIVIVGFLVLLAFVGGICIGSAWAEELLPMPKPGITTKDVTGVVCTIKKGADVYVWSSEFGELFLVSFEDQYVNVRQIWSNDKDDPDAIMFDIKGFIHDCPHHGREPIDRLTGWGFTEFKPEDCKGLDN
jgi:hypothetical protein